MKLFILSIMAMASAQAFAVPSKCITLAENTVRYAGEEAYAYDCKLAPNRVVVLCEVAAFKGGGDAVDTWRVVLNKTCSRVYRAELIGEE
jgi:hypothetical protein